MRGDIYPFPYQVEVVEAMYANESCQQKSAEQANVTASLPENLPVSGNYYDGDVRKIVKTVVSRGAVGYQRQPDDQRQQVQQQIAQIFLQIAKAKYQRK